MTKNYLSTVLFFFISYVLQAQNIGNLTFQKCFGGADEESTPAIAKTLDGGYIIASSSKSSNGDLTANKGSYDIWVKKISKSGAMIWQKNFGGTASDRSYKVIALKNGGYIIAGNTSSNDGDISGKHGVQDGLLMKLDNQGNLLWAKCYGGVAENGFYSVVEMLSGSLLVVGYTSSTDGQAAGNHGGKDLWIIKTDTSGSFLWQKCYGGTLDEIGFTICSNSSKSNFFVGGSAASNNGNLTTNKGATDAWMLKLDSTASIIFATNNGGISNEEWHDITANADGGCTVVGTTKSSGGDVSLYRGGTDIWCVRYGANATILFSKCIGGSSDEIGGSIMLLNNNSYVVCGTGNSTGGDLQGSHGSSDVVLAIVASNGDILESSVFGGSLAESNASLLNDGGIAPGSYTLICNTTSNNFDVSGNHGGEDIWFAKIGLPDGMKTPFQFRDVKVFPTIAHTEINIVTSLPEFTYSIVTMDGKEILSDVHCLDKALTYNCTALKSGMYIIRVRSGRNQVSYRFVKE